MPSENTAKATRSTPVWVDLDTDTGKLMFIMDRFKQLPSCDKELMVQFADQLPSLGRYLTAHWFLKEVHGRETRQVAESIAEGEREQEQKQTPQESDPEYVKEWKRINQELERALSRP